MIQSCQSYILLRIAVSGPLLTLPCPWSHPVQAAGPARPQPVRCGPNIPEERGTGPGRARRAEGSATAETWENVRVQTVSRSPRSRLLTDGSPGAQEDRADAGPFAFPLRPAGPAPVIPAHLAALPGELRSHTRWAPRLFAVWLPLFLRNYPTAGDASQAARPRGSFPTAAPRRPRGDAVSPAPGAEGPTGLQGRPCPLGGGSGLPRGPRPLPGPVGAGGGAGVAARRVCPEGR